MSRIGRKPVVLPDGVTVTVSGPVVTVVGPRGELSRAFHRDMLIRQDDGTLVVERPSERQLHRGLHGLTRTLLANMVQGVHSGFTKTLDIVGVGYRAELHGSRLQLALGYSHPILVVPPQGITFELPDPTRIVISGIDKELVGEVAAKVRSYRPPEPYKGKGIRYSGEYVRRKAGKAAV